MTTAKDDPDREHDSQAEAPALAAETPTRLRQAAAGMAEAQAWKGQQIAKGWRKLVNALRRREEEGGRSVSWSQRRPVGGTAEESQQDHRAINVQLARGPARSRGDQVGEVGQRVVQVIRGEGRELDALAGTVPDCF
jgi:hypothetical protein